MCLSREEADWRLAGWLSAGISPRHAARGFMAGDGEARLERRERAELPPGIAHDAHPNVETELHDESLGQRKTVGRSTGDSSCGLGRSGEGIPTTQLREDCR